MAYDLFDDYGWRHITDTKSSGFQYFEQTHPHCDDEIFSDTFSRAGCYRRISNFWLESVILSFPLLIMFSSSGLLIPDFQHWKEWYFTLWIESALLLPKGKATLSQLDNTIHLQKYGYFSDKLFRHILQMFFVVSLYIYS